MGVSKNRGTPKSSILIFLIGFSSINHPFWVPLFLETPIFAPLSGGFPDPIYGGGTLDHRNFQCGNLPSPQEAVVLSLLQIPTHTIHGNGIFTYIWLIFYGKCR